MLHVAVQGQGKAEAAAANPEASDESGKAIKCQSTEQKQVQDCGGATCEEDACC